MLMRAVTRVEADGKISIPNNMRREVGLRAGQLIELKVVGASKKKQLLLSARESAR
jgi:bifunctional DNA-binding transcriptional regulator/antitoxin component of YhaV-PrlF toxin-antitoxin module